MRFPRVLLLLLAFAIVLAACGQPKKDSEVEPEEPEEEQTIDFEEEEELPPPFTTLFTGESIEVEITNRPVAVMVENQYHARPQTGLDQADLIYEILAEGDITRFVAIYQSKEPEIIGPVRSIRPYYIELGEALDALIIHAGWSPAAQNILTREKNLAYINEVKGGDHVYFWRSKDRKAPHNVYTSMENIRKGAADKQYREEWENRGLSFYEADETIPGDDVQQLNIRYIGKYVVTYEYDEDEGAFWRSMEGEPHVDKETEEQLKAANIIIGRTSHQVLDNVGRRAVNVHGPGEGYLVQKGKVREITWELKDGLVRAYIDGVEQKLVPGHTWIQLVPNNAEITFKSADDEQDAQT